MERQHNSKAKKASVSFADSDADSGASDRAPVPPRPLPRKSLQNKKLTDVSDNEHDVPLMTVANANYIGPDDIEPADEANTTALTASPEGDKFEPKYAFRTHDLAFGVFAIALYAADVVTDIILAVTYFVDGDSTYGVWTCALIALGYIFVSVTALAIYFDDKEKHPNWWLLRIALLLLPLAPVMMTVEYLHAGMKIRRRRKGEASEKTDINSEPEKRYRAIAMYSSFLSLLESVLEAAPQLCLQMYIILKTGPNYNIHQTTIRAFVIATSWLSRAWSATAFYKHDRLHHYKGTSDKMPICGQVAYFLWRLSEAGGRVLCISLFASKFEAWVFCVLGVHLVLVIIWNFSLRIKTLSDSNSDSHRQNFCMATLLASVISIVVGFTSLFCFFDPYHMPHSRYRYVVWYALFYVENFVMLGLWVWKTPFDVHLFYIIFIVFFFIAVHVILQMVYYHSFHPSDQARWQPKLFARGRYDLHPETATSP